MQTDHDIPCHTTPTPPHSPRRALHIPLPHNVLTASGRPGGRRTKSANPIPDLPLATTLHPRSSAAPTSPRCSSSSSCPCPCLFFPSLRSVAAIPSSYPSFLPSLLSSLPSWSVATYAPDSPTKTAMRLLQPTNQPTLLLSPGGCEVCGPTFMDWLYSTVPYRTVSSSCLGHEKRS
jgi:hypothetical protein